MRRGLVGCGGGSDPVPAAWKPGSLPGQAGGGSRAPQALSFSSNYLFQDRLSLISIFKYRPLLFQLAVK